MFSDCTLLLIIGRLKTELGHSDWETSPSAGTNTGIVLVSCCLWKCVPTAIFHFGDISEGYICYGRLLLSEVHKRLVSHELTSYLSVCDLFLTHEMAILPKGQKPDNFEALNSIKLSFTNQNGFESKISRHYVSAGSF